jgi:peptidase E
MSYNYQAQRSHVFTEDGQRMFLAIRDKAEKCIKVAGAVRSQELLSVVGGDTWDMLACIDRLVELKYLREITDGGVAGQHRVFVAGDAWSSQ